MQYGSQQREVAPPDPTERLGTSLWAKGPDGQDLPPTLEDISQGTLNDCYLFAAMAAVVHNKPQRIVNMIKDNRNGTYTVTFKGSALSRRPRRQWRRASRSASTVT